MLHKGAIHRSFIADPHQQTEWAYVYQGRVRVAAVDEDGKNQVADLQVGDIWYFPKGQAHTLQGIVL